MRELAVENGMKKYSKLKRDELIKFIMKGYDDIELPTWGRVFRDDFGYMYDLNYRPFGRYAMSVLYPLTEYDIYFLKKAGHDVRLDDTLYREDVIKIHLEMYNIVSKYYGNAFLNAPGDLGCLVDIRKWKNNK
jgi:hypothetical protein